MQRFGAMWGRQQRMHSSAQGDDLSLAAQLVAEVTTSSVAAQIAHAAGAAALTQCALGLRAPML